MEKEADSEQYNWFILLAVTIRCKIFILFCSAVQLPRIATIKDVISEAFLPNVPVETSLQTRKTKEFTGPRTTKKDLEYLTLHKILSFLHAACLMKGELISHADLTRYTFSWPSFSWTCLFRAFHHALTSLNYSITKRLYFISDGFVKVSYHCMELINFYHRLWFWADMIPRS